ncbi:MAG: HAD-IC family P-type ATPase [Candidatus Pacebacteria bacterium]|nr:HAD-IC family P-type ATPase [Candidatus Paceibacterota bacterium]
MTKKQKWYSLSIKEIEKYLNTDLNAGLKSSDIQKIQKKFGRNLFDKKRDFGLLGKIFSQFKSPLIFILLIAGIITFFLKEYSDSIVIFLALFINTFIGTFQENKASNAFDKLSKLQQKQATVIRDGKKSVILAEDLVPGDLVVLNSGMFIPADLRLIEEKNLLINESVLTGEWADVVKETKVTASSLADKSLNKQINMVWMGTTVSSGNALGVVVEIGDKTEIGKIAQSLNLVKEEKTPIKESLEKLAKFLSILVLVVLAVIFFLGLVRGESVTEMLIIAIAMAVAVMPEGLPIAVTSVLAVGMSNILKKGGLVRNLLAAETLGSTTYILTDKTGTLTEAKMHLDKVYTWNFINDGGNQDDEDLIKMAVLSSDAFIDEGNQAPDNLIVRGRPIEKAIILAGIEHGFTQDDLFNDRERLDFHSFESKNGFSASLNKDKKRNKLYVSGIPEMILEKSKFIYHNGKEKKMTRKALEHFLKTQKQKSLDGVRFIALAYKKVDWEKIPNLDREENQDNLNDLVFVGLLAFSDPIRADVKESIKKAQMAGTHVVMVTGDNPNTASKIAEEVGIIKKGDKILTGAEIEEMRDSELFEELKTVRVFARMNPSQKLRLSKILQKNGEVVAMTGDGVNDAPALQGADIGIVMESGTEVSKEASDLILLGGDFSTITFAIEEGRRLIDNLKKILGYLLSTSFAEFLIIGGALLVGLPLPILPTQILWSNIIQEGLMNFTFVFEPGEKDLMKRNPSSMKKNNILTKELKMMIFTVGLSAGIFLLLVYLFIMQTNMTMEKIRTIMFASVSLGTVFFSISFKSFHLSFWKINIFSNKYLIFSLLISMFFLFIALFVPPVRDMLSLVKLTGGEIILLGIIGIFNFAIIELSKYFVFRRARLSNIL